jgi:hypothetical protein
MLFEEETERTPQRPLTTRKEPLAGSIRKEISVSTRKETALSQPATGK